MSQDTTDPAFSLGPSGDFLRGLWELNHLLERASRRTEALHGVTGQQRPAPPRPATLDDLLEELRAFRSELRDSSATSLRAQLLLARLQLQEQRVNTIWRQLSEVEDKLQATEKEGAAPEHILKLMGVQPGTDPPAQMAPVIEMFKTQMAASERANTDLKQRQAELLQLMTNEQSRWTTLNAEIEALEKALTAARPQR